MVHRVSGGERALESAVGIVWHQGIDGLHEQHVHQRVLRSAIPHRHWCPLTAVSPQATRVKSSLYTRDWKSGLLSR